MATESPAQGFQHPLQTVKNTTGWPIAVAVLFIVLGMFAIIEPGVAGLGVTILVAWLLIFGGLTHLIGALKGGGAKRAIVQAMTGILYLIAGIYLRMHPLLAIGTLTLLLAAVILAGGLLEIISYFRLKGEGTSGWLLFNGVITLLLGGMIWIHWPSSSAWAIGILVGVNLLTTGMTRLLFWLGVRKFVGRAAA
jgi:uncharacterized membrane protein HdeD (DUF308 family)